MTLLSIVVELAVVVTGLLVLTTVLVLESPWILREQLPTRGQVRGHLPYVVLLASVLVVNSVARRFGADVSWLLGWNVTGYLYAIEGGFVPWLQSFATPPMTAFFSAVYIYGYVYLLVFPLLAYVLHDDPIPFREAAIAYSLNYAIGLAAYLLFVSYGPRNFLPELVDPLLYTAWPRSQLLVSEVNQNTNVFPSLHTSLSITVALLAYRTRDRYARWQWVAVPLAASVVVSTMYLGIHWGVDVLAGALLAVVSVLGAVRFVSRPSR